MGLLGQIIGDIAGNALGGSSLDSRQGQAGAGGAGGTMLGRGALMALLPVVMAMLANRGQPGAAGGAQGGPSGGLLGGALGGGLGGGLGGSMGDALGGLLGGAMGSSPGAGGGLAGMLEQFQRHGFGQQVSSWVGNGPNEPLTPDAVGQVLGADGVDHIAQQAGMSPDAVRSGLAELLPEVVDHFTPDGQVPPLDQLSSSVDDYFTRLQR